MENTCNCKEECKEECTCGQQCTCESSSLEKDKHKKHKKNKEQEKLNMALEALAQAQDAATRAQAELVNYRKRKDDEVSKLLLYCNESIVKELLPTLDNFERAIKQENGEDNEILSKFLEGIKLIYCSMVNTLEKYGVKAIDGANKPFDPKYHQAVLLEQRDDIEKGMVIEVLQKGYLLKDRVIRPAMVRVSE